MNEKNIIKPITVIDEVSVLDIKYGIKVMSIDGILVNFDGTPYGDLPTDFELKHQELIDEYNAANYQRSRKMEYPPITDYIDGVVKGDQAQIDAYITKCLEVKAKYPKPNSNE